MPVSLVHFTTCSVHFYATGADISMIRYISALQSPAFSMLNEDMKREEHIRHLNISITINHEKHIGLQLQHNY